MTFSLWAISINGLFENSKNNIFILPLLMINNWCSRGINSYKQITLLPVGGKAMTELRN